LYDQFSTFISVHWLEIKEFFNSVFFTAIAGSFAGAFAGAYGAQRIAEKAKYRDQLLKEIRGTNTAIMLAFGICNSLLSIKKQHVKSLKEDFDTQKTALLDYKRKRELGLISKDQVFHYKADFQTLSLPPLPVDILQTQVFEKLSLVGRPISLTTTLSQTVHSLSSSLAKRNQQIETYKANDGASIEEYFGLPLNGQINEIYPSLINAIYRQTDDGIFFSQLLCRDMIEHGNMSIELFNKSFKKGAPTISKTDFSKAEKLGLMPNADNYADWITMFAKIPTEQSK
jgi:hypothetical protein